MKKILLIIASAMTLFGAECYQITQGNIVPIGNVNDFEDAIQASSCVNPNNSIHKDCIKNGKAHYLSAGDIVCPNFYSDISNWYTMRAKVNSVDVYINDRYFKDLLSGDAEEARKGVMKKISK